jgi:UDP-N-acetylglucosamine 2-epimerase (non-hydrolysing)
VKIISLVGARPQFIKEAVIHKEIKLHKNIHEILVHSGQHYDFNMSDIFFEELEIRKPDYFLNVDSGLHGEMTGKK